MRSFAKDSRIKDRIISIDIYSNLHLILLTQVCIPHKAEAICAGRRIIKGIHLILIVRIIQNYSIDTKDSVTSPHTGKPGWRSLMNICDRKPYNAILSIDLRREYRSETKSCSFHRLGYRGDFLDIRVNESLPTIISGTIFSTILGIDIPKFHQICIQELGVIHRQIYLQRIILFP